MLRILIGEDDLNVASTLRHMIEENMLFFVVGVVDESESAVRVASRLTRTLPWSTYSWLGVARVLQQPLSCSILM